MAIPTEAQLAQRRLEKRAADAVASRLRKQARRPTPEQVRAKEQRQREKRIQARTEGALTKQERQRLDLGIEESAIETRKLMRSGITTRAEIVLEDIPSRDRALMFDLEPDQPLDLSLEDPRHTQLEEADERELHWFWQTLFRPHVENLEKLGPYRTRVAWRVVREMARLKNQISTDEPLSKALSGVGEQFDQWEDPTAFTPGKGNTQYDSLSWEVCELISKQGGLSLLPPSVPPEWKDERHRIKDDYDPRIEAHDPRLHRWLLAFSKIAMYLRIASGSELDPEQGRYGLYGMNDPDLIRLTFPSRMQIIMWEEIVIDETVGLLVRYGTTNTRKRLRKLYGLTEAEINSIIKMAYAQARDAASTDTEEHRSLMVLRIEDFLRRSRKSFDMRAELGGLKQLTIVLGLSKTDPDDLNKEFGDIVRAVSAKARTIEVGQGNQRLLTSKGSEGEYE